MGFRPSSIVIKGTRLSDFERLGAQFRQAREARELSLQEVERQTRIRLKFLQAIEHGHFQSIDNPTQLRGFLRQYAKAVGLDDGVVLAQYEEALRGQRRRRGKLTTIPAPVSVPSPSREQLSATDPELLFERRRRAPYRLFFAIILAVALTGTLIGGIVITVNDLTSEDEPTAQPAIQVVDPNALNDSLATPTQAQFPTIFNTPVINPEDGIFITITVTQRLWAEVIVDGEQKFSGLLRPPSDLLNYSARESITIRTSNAAGMRLLINNQAYMLGSTREAVERTFTIQGIFAPTPQATSSPTTSLTPTQTFAVSSITATITNTASPASPNTATLFFNLPTAIPTLAFSTVTNTPTQTLVQPTAIPTLTPSPFLPPRFTRTPTIEK